MPEPPNHVAGEQETWSWRKNFLTVCDEARIAVEAQRGVCPIHQGDACLVVIGWVGNPGLKSYGWQSNG